MTADLSRRMMLGLLAGSSALLGSAPAFAQAGNGLLDKVRKAGVIKIGITNGLP